MCKIRFNSLTFYILNFLVFDWIQFIFSKEFELASFRRIESICCLKDRIHISYVIFETFIEIYLSVCR